MGFTQIRSSDIEQLVVSGWCEFEHWARASHNGLKTVCFSVSEIYLPLFVTGLHIAKGVEALEREEEVNGWRDNARSDTW